MGGERDLAGLFSLLAGWRRSLNLLSLWPLPWEEAPSRGLNFHFLRLDDLGLRQDRTAGGAGRQGRLSTDRTAGGAVRCWFHLNLCGRFFNLHSFPCRHYVRQHG